MWTIQIVQKMIDFFQASQWCCTGYEIVASLSVEMKLYLYD